MKRRKREEYRLAVKAGILPIVKPKPIPKPPKIKPEKPPKAPKADKPKKEGGKAKPSGGGPK